MCPEAKVIVTNPLPAACPKSKVDTSLAVKNWLLVVVSNLKQLDHIQPTKVHPGLLVDLKLVVEKELLLVKLGPQVDPDLVVAGPNL